MESALLLLVSLILTGKLILLFVAISLSLLFIWIFIFRLMLHGEFVLCWMLLIGNLVVLPVLLIVFLYQSPISWQYDYYNFVLWYLIKKIIYYSGNLISWWTTFSKLVLGWISFGNFALVIWSTFFFQYYCW